MRQTEIVISSASDKQVLAEEFNAKRSLISKALHFSANSMVARKMRCYAINQLGCKVYIRKSSLNLNQ